ncbi:unnamed protein product [Menidia menidia]|uniref:(Atlantic silverside) hypothetical protein n=1 Tax=Menidia menidia TaxID=238744 RepID=A0A8S4B9E8_9TELE|nr:unnamed protein product [Menidia menidia]
MSDGVPKGQTILCDMCADEDRKPARKTCMKCEISMCGQHLQAHLTTPVLLQTHPLTEPVAIDGSTKCPVHGKLLEYYCLDDRTCVCVSCAIEDQHRLHNMKTFPTAHKELLENIGAQQKALQDKSEDENVSLEKWDRGEREKVGRGGARLVEAVTHLRDVSLTSVQSSVAARMASIRTSRSSMEAAQKEKDTFRFLQLYSQVHRDMEAAKAVDLRRGLEPGADRDKLALEIQQKGQKMLGQASQFLGSLLTLVDPENHLEMPTNPGPDLVFEPQTSASSVSLSTDRRKVFHNGWLGACSATLLITGPAPNLQRWTVGLPTESDWMVGLCQKQSANTLMQGPVYGLLWEEGRLGRVTTEEEEEKSAGFSFGSSANPPGKKLKVSSESFPNEGDDGGAGRPETVEVLWKFPESKLTFYSRTGRFQRKEITTIQMSCNSWDLVPFVRLGKENVQKSNPNHLCSCGRNTSGFQANCSRCGKVFPPFTTDLICELH